jgi:hypothetical protein
LCNREFPRLIWKKGCFWVNQEMSGRGSFPMELCTGREIRILLSRDIARLPLRFLDFRLA